MIYTEEILSELISCSKEIVEPPKPFRDDRGYKKTNFTLHSIDQQYNFYVFIRQNTQFVENFSIGIDYNPKDEKGTLALLRCNGPHGENNMYPHHISSHIHKATSERINIGLKPEGNIIITDEYSTLYEAIQFFINEININISDRNKYFPIKEKKLFNDE